jgi:peptide/nickel transport system substrate-binding protein
MRAFIPALLLLTSTAFAEVKNPDTYTYATISDADSFDPAWSYDTASHLVILNLYEPLFAYDGTSTEKLIPLIAAQVPSKANKLISEDGKKYIIPIRKGVTFQDGTPLTPEDVRWSIMRFILSDRSAGPSSLLMEPLLGYPATRDEKGVLNKDAFKDADKAVKLEGNNLVLRLPKPYAPLLTILASWAPILPKAWAVKQGDWDGTAETWEKYNNPRKESSPFYEKANGSGAFALERWDRKTKEVIFLRNEKYWRKPAKLKRVVMKSVNEFGTRKLMLKAGDADAIYATSPEWSQLQGLEGVSLIDDLPTMEMNPVAFFTFEINAVGNPNIGSGRLDGNGIPSNFFADKDLRKAFAYSIDYKGYIKDVFRGKGTQATGCIPKSLPGNNPKQATFSFDLEQAKQHFLKAWGGKVWEQGFKFTLTYNTGNPYRQTLCQMLKRNIESVNSKFKIDVRPVEWPTFLDNYKSSKLPLFVMGWNADFPDPHNFAFPLMHSKGDYPLTQKYKNEEADKLVEAANNETDIAKRKALYAKLIAIEHEEVPHIVVVDSTRFRTQRSWMKGWYHNPVFPDSPYGAYFYPLSKGQ